MKKQIRQKKKRIKVPVLWRICLWFCMILLVFTLFMFMLRKQGVSFPIAAGQSTDPYFFAGALSILIPLFLGFCLEVIMAGICAKKSASEITKDVTVMTAAAVLDGMVSGGDSTDNRTSDSEGPSGGGGGFGGGGASGGF